MATDPATEAQYPHADSPTTWFFGESVGTEEPETQVEEDWVTIARPEWVEGATDKPLSMRRVVAQLAIGIAVILAVVTIGGSFAARRLAEREAVNDAANTADVLAETVVQPNLTDALFDGDPAAQAAFAQLIRSHVLSTEIVHVKLWSPTGKVVYADERDLVGRTFPLDPEQEATLEEPRTVAEISNLDRDENALDRASDGKLVEVYRPVWSPGGETMLFEIYAPYDEVADRTGQLWRGFAGVTLSSLLLFLVLISPLIWHLVVRVRRDQQQRTMLLERAVDASSSERRLIAATLHDGPVQELAASSFVVAGAAERARAAGHNSLAEDLKEVAASVRTSIRALRSLLVDIYPASLSRAGLKAALTDLAHSVRAPGLDVRVEVDDDAVESLGPEQERLVYRIAQETLRNVAKHAAPCTADVLLYRDGQGVVLDVVDDGVGFDVEAWLDAPEEGHLGVRLLGDLAATGGGLLQVASAPNRGTHWRLRIEDTNNGGTTDE